MSSITQRLNAAKKAAASAQKKVESLQKEYDGDVPSPDQLKLFKRSLSFTVWFQRRKLLKKVRSPGAVCKSLRRFSSIKEATHHAKRFSKKHRHLGYKIVKVAKRPNAWVNWRTGKTNPVLFS